MHTDILLLVATQSSPGHSSLEIQRFAMDVLGDISGSYALIGLNWCISPWWPSIIAYIDRLGVHSVSFSLTINVMCNFYSDRLLYFYVTF